MVIIRYTEDASEVMVPFVASKTYTGETLTATVAADDRYTVTANDGGVNVGDYTVTLTLTSGCHWNGGSTDPTNLVFTITPAQNAWTVEPAISKGYWLTTDDPGVLTAGATTFGTVTATYKKDGGAAEPYSAMPTAPGEYVVTYTAPVSDNYSSPDPASKSVSFSIFNVDETPPFTVATNGFMTADVSAAKVNVSVPYRVECEVQSSKLVDVFAHYALEGSDTTNAVKIASEVALDATGTGTLEDLVPGTNYWVSLSGQGGSTVAPTTMPVKVVTPGPAMGLTASAVFTNDPKEFVLSGSVTPGLGTTTVYLRWSLNSVALDNVATYTFAFGDTGAFSTNIAYTAPNDTLTWAVAVSNEFASASYGDLAWNDTRSAQTKTRVDMAATTYTWTGNGGDNLWTNFANWTANVTAAYGYPDNKNYATARFTNAVVVALNGGKFGLGAQGLVVSSNRGEVRLQNGTLDFPSSDFSFGASGTDVVFDLVTLTGLRALEFVSGCKTVFIGNTAQGWSYEPWGIDNTRMVVRDGTMSSGYFQVWIAADRRHYVDITNAVWTVNGNIISAGNPGLIANVVTLRDGADRQAQFVTTGTMNFTDTWDIKIPEDGHAKPSIQAVDTFDNTTGCIFKLDVTDCNRGLKVPLVRFTGADQTARMNNKNFTLRALDNGVDVTAKRNARLEWSQEDNTLYYKQDGQLGLLISVR